VEFSYRERGDGSVAISHRGRVVTTLRREAARRFLARASSVDEEARQQLMARATGNFKRGNERRGR
jgi:hypothetical protein